MGPKKRSTSVLENGGCMLTMSKKMAEEFGLKSIAFI
jgi:hypothetical protein